MAEPTPRTPDVRILGRDDATAYHAVRLEGLREAPTAFGSSLEEEASLTQEQVEARLTASLPTIATFGAFLDGALVGIATFVGNTRLKTRHKSTLAGMYVTAAARGAGVARLLVDAVLAYARAQPEVEDISLTVTVGNEPAQRLYRAAGFRTVATIPRYLKIDGQHYDMDWMERTVK
jgi:ribosomal protein S18 acetylase RimI-like enzyme